MHGMCPWGHLKVTRGQQVLKARGHGKALGLPQGCLEEGTGWLYPDLEPQGILWEGEE